MIARRMLIGTLQMIGGAVMLSFFAVFVKWAHVGPTMAGFYRMLLGSVRQEGIRKDHFAACFFAGTLKTAGR